MSSQYEESLTTLILKNAGEPSEGQYRLRIDYLVWLIDHCTRLDVLRLELLKGLQAGLSKSDDQDHVIELKELLTNLIIMQTRLSDREDSLHDALSKLVEDNRLLSVLFDEELPRKMIEEIVNAPEQVRSLSSDGI